MAPRARFTRVKGKRQEHRAGSQGRTPIKKSAPKQQAGSRRSVRLKNKAPVSYEVHSTAPVSQLSRLKRKRSQTLEAEADETEGVRPRKQPRRLPSPKCQLSADNLRILNGDMNILANDGPALKRTSSRRSVAASDTETVRSQRSSNTAASYRFKHLAAADIYIHTDLPDDIQAAIDRVIGIKISNDRRDRLGNITKTFHEACKETVQAAAGEDDFVDILYTALKSMSPDNILFRVKAEWREELKPIIHQSNLNLSFLENFSAIHQQYEGNDISIPPPPKRQQQSTGQTQIGPQSSMVEASDSTSVDRPAHFDITRPLASCPFPEKAKESSLVKTPRPDISIGIKETALVSALSALSSQNLNNREARRFLGQLEDTTVPSERGGTTEPLLIAVPTQRASDLIFPFAVVEGKAYSTGKQVFEAQNQAAVSGASGLKIQLSLNELVKRSTRSIDGTHPQSNDPPALFFSICTEGPYHELWVHYTHVEDNVRKFKMKLLKICNGVLLESVGDFIVAVDNMLRWGTGRFLHSVVERLGMVARKAGV